MFWCPPWSNSGRYLFKQRVKKLNLWRRTAVDKSAWIKAFLYFSLLPPTAPLTAPKNENFKTIKKGPEDSILRKYTKNNDHMLHCSWDMALIRCNCYFSFSAIFSTLTPFTAQKISQKWKKTLEVSTFTTSVPKIIIICFIVPEIWHLTDVIVSFHFGLFLAILPP